MDDASSVACHMAYPTVKAGKRFSLHQESGITFPTCPSNPHMPVQHTLQDHTRIPGQSQETGILPFSFLAHAPREWYQFPLVFPYIPVQHTSQEHTRIPGQRKTIPRMWYPVFLFFPSPYTKRMAPRALDFLVHSSTTYNTLISIHAMPVQHTLEEHVGIGGEGKGIHRRKIKRNHLLITTNKKGRTRQIAHLPSLQVGIYAHCRTVINTVSSSSREEGGLNLYSRSGRWSTYFIFRVVQALSE